MGAPVSMAGRAEFEERLARIERKRTERTAGRQGASRRQGPGSAAAPGARTGGVRGLPLRLLALCVAPVLGAACAIGGNAGAFHLLAGGLLPNIPRVPRIEAVADLGLAAVLLCVAFLVLGTRRGPRPTLVLLGFCAALFGESLLAERFPGVWARLYGPEQAARMASASEMPEGALRRALDAAVVSASASSEPLWPQAVKTVTAPAPSDG